MMIMYKTVSLKQQMTIQASLVLRDIFQFNAIWHGRFVATLISCRKPAESDSACYQSHIWIEYINEIIIRLI